MHTLIVHNPRSGFGSNAIFEFERSLVEAGDTCELRIVAPDFDPAVELANAELYDCVVLSGGDGTVSNMLYVLRNRNVAACVFPSGTANLLAGNISNGFEPIALARACRNGYVANTDLGEIFWTSDADQTARHTGFSIMAGLGFDAALMEAAIPNKKTMGEFAYFLAALSNPNPTVSEFEITVDGVIHRRRGITCLVANNATIQGDITIAPECTMTDGTLDVIVVETTSIVELISPLLAGMLDKAGKSTTRPNIETFSGHNITVRSSVPLPLELDGEVIPGLVTSYRARALGGANYIIVDPMSPYYEEAQKWSDIRRAEKMTHTKKHGNQA